MQMSGLKRFEGRLFTDAGHICLVVETDEVREIARVSRSVDGKREIVEIPVATVSQRISAGASLVLDDLGEPELAKRLVRKPDGWFFPTREGWSGPFLSGSDAEKELAQYILASANTA